MTTISFGTKLRYVREMREMKQVQVAKAAGMDPAMIANFEADRREPSLPNLRKLCKALLVSSDYLLGLSERIGP